MWWYWFCFGCLCGWCVALAVDFSLWYLWRRGYDEIWIAMADGIHHALMQRKVLPEPRRNCRPDLAVKAEEERLAEMRRLRES